MGRFPVNQSSIPFIVTLAFNFRLWNSNLLTQFDNIFFQKPVNGAAVEGEKKKKKKKKAKEETESTTDTSTVEKKKKKKKIKTEVAEA